MIKRLISKQAPEVNDASSSHFFIFHFFTIFSFFHSPRCSFLLVAPSSLLLLPPRLSILFIAPSSVGHSSSSLLPSSLSLLPPRCPLLPPSSSFLLPLHLKAIKSIISVILTKALPTNQPTNGRTSPLIEMRTHLKTGQPHRVKTDGIKYEGLYLQKNAGETDEDLLYPSVALILKRMLRSASLFSTLELFIL